MPIAAITDIGPAEIGAVRPIAGVRPLSDRGTVLVRPVGTGERQLSPSERNGGPGKDQSSPAPVVGTAYQTNADGDSATFASRLNHLTGQERARLDWLRRRDQEVRTHEAAHKAAAGGLASGGPSYETHTGPDGRDYAVGGHVKIDTSPGRTPEETIAKAQRIRQAALAPADPSAQDRAVAAKAARMEAQARAEIARRKADPQARPSRPDSGSAPARSTEAGRRVLDLFA